MTVRVQREDFDLGVELKELGRDNPDVGAVVGFTGRVRDASGGLAWLELEHYPGMTERQLEKLEAEARTRWPLDAVLIIHRYGKLAPREQIVLTATASKHRDAAFEACRFLMDRLKTEAPFWKREETVAGDSEWVEARPQDQAAADRWKADRWK